MSRGEFEDLVAEALDTIPPRLTKLMQNVVIVVEDALPHRRERFSGCTKASR